MPQSSPDTLPAPVAHRLTEFARACKGAARTVGLYPGGHPAVDAALARLAEAGRRATVDGPVTLTVLPGGLLADGCAFPRPDAAIAELATLLHEHLVGELRVADGASAEAWRAFLRLLARPTDEVQGEGGMARLWAGTGEAHLQLREIDYAEVLRDRAGGIEAGWDRIVANCLAGDAVALDAQATAALLEIAGDAQRLAELTRQIDERAAGDGGVRARARALVRLLQHLAESVMRTRPDDLERVMGNAASAAARLSPEVMLELLTQRYQAAPGTPDVVGAMVDRMSDASIAQFVASSVVTERGATARLAQALQALVPDEEHQRAVVELAGAELAQSSLARETTFQDLWKSASDMLLSYRDETFVSSEYARELTTARSQAVEVERASDDPPERVAAWLATVSDAAVRELDLQLLADLLRIETDPDRWRELMDPVVSHVTDLILLGDVEGAAPLVTALAREAGDGGSPARRPAAAAGLSRLLGGPLMAHLVGHLRTIDDAALPAVRDLIQALGPATIRPLAEALAGEERGRAFRRLTDLLVGFGSLGREAVEQLKGSPNPAVRRTAIHLLREFGGNDALPELAPLLDDAEPNVQREALRAIVNIGTDEAYAVLAQALGSGSPRSHDAIVGALGTLRDERAIPLFCHMVRSPEYRRTQRAAYLTALDGLGALGGSEAVDALREALYRGEWWAPLRTSALRQAAAAALRRIGDASAVQALEEASANGPRGVRAAARGALARLPVRRPDPGGRPA